MTQVGKILVLVIMAFSLMFLAISTMVFMTSKNWKTETAKKADEVNKVKKSLADAQAEVGLAKKNLEEAQATAQQATKALESRIQHAGRDTTSATWRRSPRSASSSPCSAECQDGPGRGRGPSQGDDGAARAEVGRREAGQRVSAPPGRAQRQDPRARADARDRDQEQRATCASASPSTPRCSSATGCPPTSARSRAWRARRRSPGRSRRSTRPTSGSRSPSAPTTAWSSATSCSSTAPSPAPSTSAAGRSSPWIPTRPWSGSWATPSRARR